MIAVIYMFFFPLGLIFFFFIARVYHPVAPRFRRCHVTSLTAVTGVTAATTVTVTSGVFLFVSLFVVCCICLDAQLNLFILPASTERKVTKLGYDEEDTKCICDILMYSQLR